MLSFNGWIAGLSASIILISGIIIGLYCIYKSRKTNANLLFIMGLGIIFIGLIYLGLFCDFLTILLTGDNLDNTYGLIGILGNMWVPPAVICGMYIGTELMMPRLKWYVIAIYGVLAIIFELFLFLDPFGSINFIEPSTPGEDLIDDPFVVGSPFFVFFFFFLFSIIVFDGFGFLIRSIQSTGIIRKKFLYISLGFLIFLIIGTLEIFPISGIVLFLVRINTVASFWLWYLGLKEVHVKEDKIILAEKAEVKESEISLVDTLSLSRPSEITEKEVSISKEKKICLVCKGKVARYNYICPECDTFYCVNCANTLEDLENACWVCETPFDETKPVKPYKREEEIGIEISEKSLKKSKNDKKPS